MFLIGGMLQSSLLLNCLVQFQSHQLHFVKAFQISWFQWFCVGGKIQHKNNSVGIMWNQDCYVTVDILYIFLQWSNTQGLHNNQ